MSFHKIPEELKQLRQWVLWKKELRDGRATKVPYQITGKKASAENPKTWVSYEVVCEVWQQGLYDGIGFVFSSQDPYVGVDLDNCVVDGQWTEEAYSIVRQLNSYSELSPSGSGIHMIVKATKPGTRCRTANVEMYDHSRFFTMTGQDLENGPTTIQHRQVELNELYRRLFNKEKPKNGASVTTMTDEEVLKKAQNAKNGKKFSTLYGGDIREYEGDDSAADLALCNMLAFWTTDFDQIDRLFRRSGLMREKWERFDYRKRTIEWALSEVTERYSSKVKRPDRTGSGANANVTSTVTQEVYHELTDLGNSKRFKEQYGHVCFYVYPFREWYIWNGRYWEKDQNGGIMRLAKKVAEMITKTSKGQSDAVLRHAQRSESLSAIKSMVHLAKSELPVSPDQLDIHHWLLNVQNGTIDPGISHST
jgi:putative DNA primase/helicase